MRFVFLALALLFFFIWIGAFIVFHVAAALIHLLLIGAVIFLIVAYVGGFGSTFPSRVHNDVVSVAVERSFTALPWRSSILL